MRFQRSIHATLVAICGLFLVAFQFGCSSSIPPTEFTNPNIDFAFVQRVAVLPFENLANDQQAGFRATRLMITELLASGAVDVVEPGEVDGALARLPGRVARPTIEQLISLGQDLRVQAIIMGTVTQSEVLRSGAVGRPVVTLDAQMVETETGAVIWAATHTEKGGSFSARVLGTGGVPLSETTRKCVQSLLATLLD